MPKRKTAPLPPRFSPILSAYLAEMLTGADQTTVATEIGMGQSTLSEQANGKKTATLETVDKVARYRKQSVAQVLIRLRDIAVAKGQDEPGWEEAFAAKFATTPLPGVVRGETEQHRRERVVRERQARAKAKGAK